MKRTASFIFVLIFTISTTTIAQPVGASNSNMELSETTPHCGICETAESPSFAKSAPGKIGRGVVNILLGWTNLIAQPIKAGTSGGNALSGIGSGFNLLVVRTIQGVTELGLFWLPPSHGEPLKHCALGDLGITGR